MPGNIIPYIESMEIKGHLAARQASRSLDLMRRSWGWYLNNPAGTNSTLIEGYLADGTFGYRTTPNDGYGSDVSYCSHAHGWSTGPTHALSYYVLGLQLSTPGGQNWVLAPQVGNLNTVEGGLTTNLGKFSAKWIVGNGFTLSYAVPSGTSGTLILPASSGSVITIDGNVYTGGTFDSGAGLRTIPSQPGGSHSIVVK